jgi:phosphatidylglycerophosphatase A
MKLWVAQGFGLGRIPFAPGTWGSVLGLGWFGLLLCAHSLVFFAIGTVVGLGLSVWLCGEAEKILKAHDPGSVVLDEIAAIPVCFAGWLMIVGSSGGGLPGPSYFFSKERWVPTLVIFALFRLFDITKPWPVRQSQSLPGGWGVTVDDALAAVYVNLAVCILRFFWKF